MMKIITGFIPPSSGNVLVNGIETCDGSLEIKKKIGYLPENNPLYPEMYIREYLQFAASLYKSDIPLKKQIDNIIEVTGLAPEQKKKIGSLSKGYRQRVGLAQALIHNPDVLIRDAGREKTVMLSTHIMQEVEAICNRVIIIDKGIIVADEEKKDIYSKIRQAKQVILVEFDRDPDEASLKAIPLVESVEKTKGNTWLIEALGDLDIRPAIFSYAVSNNLTVLSLQKKENNLEEIFRILTNG
jgi:ABC-2 type transport system ATP-binding protein